MAAALSPLPQHEHVRLPLLVVAAVGLLHDAKPLPLVEALLGYLAGVPTYTLLAERAVAVVLRGTLPCAGGYPDKLAAAAPARWRFHRRFSLEYARMLAERGDVVATVGQVAKAIIEEAHAVLCERRRWVLNEKRIVDAADLGWAHARFKAVPSAPLEFSRWVADLASSLEELR